MIVNLLTEITNHKIISSMVYWTIGDLFPKMNLDKRIVKLLMAKAYKLLIKPNNVTQKGNYNVQTI